MTMDYNTYQLELTRFVKDKLPEFYAGLAKFYYERGGNPDSLSYFYNHFARFGVMLELCKRHNLQPKEICELGSWYPYTSYYFKLSDPAVAIDMYDIVIRQLGGLKEFDVDGVKLTDFNLCTDILPDKQYDLIILSEVMEHLPMNLFRLEQNVIKIMKPGGYLLVTYPLGGNNPKDYEKELEGYDQSQWVEPHLREFTAETTLLFFKELELIESTFFSYPAYGDMKAVLYRKRPNDLKVDAPFL